MRTQLLLLAVFCLAVCRISGLADYTEDQQEGLADYPDTQSDRIRRSADYTEEQQEGLVDNADTETIARARNRRDELALNGVKSTPSPTNDTSSSKSKREVVEDIHKRSTTQPAFSMWLWPEPTGYSTTKYFVSTAVATTIFHRTGYDYFAVQNNQRFKNMAKALAPAIVRVGGIGSGFLVFWKDGVNFPVSTANQVMFERNLHTGFWNGSANGYSHFNVTQAQWEVVHRFFMEVGWDVNLNINSFLWNYNNQVDFRNVKTLLDFCMSASLPIYGIQLFNEPNSYGVKFPGFERTTQQLIDDWNLLKALQNDPNYSFFNNTLRIGPDVTSIGRHTSAYRYLEQFFKEGGGDSQDVLGLHHYYFNGPTATISDFLNPDNFDTLGLTVKLGKQLVDQYKPGMPVHLSETSNAYNGGSPLYSHGYLSTLIWMDQLGQAALYGAEVVNRYTYFSGDYSMVGMHASPHPDYWVAVLHKRLIEGPVLNINITDSTTKNVRLYAHCVRTDYSHQGKVADIGGIVITYINLYNTNVTLNTDQLKFKEIHLYQFTQDPTIGSDELAFESSNIYLNDHKLFVNSDCVPTMEPTVLKKQLTVNLPRYSSGFIVVPTMGNTICANR